jgi:hypothetical protein
MEDEDTEGSVTTVRCGQIARFTVSLSDTDPWYYLVVRVDETVAFLRPLYVGRHTHTHFAEYRLSEIGVGSSKPGVSMTIVEFE